jgi:hypothetical protein
MHGALPLRCTLRWPGRRTATSSLRQLTRVPLCSSTCSKSAVSAQPQMRNIYLRTRRRKLIQVTLWSKHAVRPGDLLEEARMAPPPLRVPLPGFMHIRNGYRARPCEGAAAQHVRSVLREVASTHDSSGCCACTGCRPPSSHAL